MSFWFYTVDRKLLKWLVGCLQGNVCRKQLMGKHGNLLTLREGLEQISDHSAVSVFCVIIVIAIMCPKFGIKRNMPSAEDSRKVDHK